MTNATADIPSQLAQADWLADAPLALLEWLADECEDVRLGSGDIVYASGEPAEQCFVLLRGRVGAGRPRHDGPDESHVIWYFIADTPATTLCLENVITGIPYFATMQALEDGTRILAMSATTVTRVLDEHPRTGLEVARHVARRLQAFTEEAVEIALLDTNRRLARYLLRLAHPDGSVSPMTQQQFASRLATNRQSVNAAIGHFVRRGWIEPAGRSRYRIVDRDAMARYAGEISPSGAERFL